MLFIGPLIGLQLVHWKMENKIMLLATACISIAGQRFAMLEEKVVMCHLMRNFTVTSSVKRDDIVVMATFILKPAKPVPIRLIARK